MPDSEIETLTEDRSVFGPIATTRHLVTALVLFAVTPTAGYLSQPKAPDLLWALTLMTVLVMLIVGLRAGLHLLIERPASYAIWSAWAVAGSMLIAAAVNTPIREHGYFGTGAAFVGASLASSMTLMDETRFSRFVAAPLIGAAALQAGLMAVQLITQTAVGPGWLGYPDVELDIIDGLVRPQGTMVHVFEPALLATVALGSAAAMAPRIGRHPVWLAGVAAATAAVALSHSRAALLGILFICGALYLAHRRGTPGAGTVAAVILIGFVVSAAFVAPGWQAKATDSATLDTDELSNGRLTLARQALVVIGDHPLTGVGPGGYLPTMVEEYQIDPDHPFKVHNAALGFMAEWGIPLGLAVTALLVLTGIQAIRAGALAAATFLGMTPWLLFDINYYDRPAGLLVFGAWFGVTGFAIRLARHRSLATRSS